MPTPLRPAYRTVRFRELHEIIDDCERLAAAECTLLGNWSLAQIVRHLAQGIDCSFEGFGFQVNWFQRTFLGRLKLLWVLKFGMPRGVRLPESAMRLLPMSDPDLAAALDHLRASIRRLETEIPTHRHPMFGRLTHDEARRLTLRHAELHLSYVVPTVSADM